MDIETDEMTEVCRLATIGYDLDNGGYAFEPGEDDWSGFCVVDSGIGDYLPWSYENCPINIRTYDMTCVFDVHAHWDHMPLLARVGDTVYVKLHSVHLNETDHDCNCHGRPLDPDAVTATEGDWEWTGDPSDGPFPNCDRCEGEGYVTSPGGVMAFYAPIESVLDHLQGSHTALAGFLLTRSAESYNGGLEHEAPETQVAYDAVMDGRVSDVLPILSANRE